MRDVPVNYTVCEDRSDEGRSYPDLVTARKAVRVLWDEGHATAYLSVTANKE